LLLTAVSFLTLIISKEKGRHAAHSPSGQSTASEWDVRSRPDRISGQLCFQHEGVSGLSGTGINE
ncbi:hypothetical protein, partial [Erwinia sp.]|uniref:hypothetical protein n=1 Tax=Erwinia citreus TaxID=558 RepID=UPI00289F8342